MKNIKIYLSVFLIIILSLSSEASHKKEIYNAFVSNNMVRWKLVIDLMQTKNDISNDFTLDLINYQYGYIAWCIDNEKIDEAKYYLKIARSNIKNLAKKGYKNSDISAYESAFYGFDIMISWYKAPYCGPKSLSYAENSIELDKSNPLGYIELGNANYYMPERFGGSKITAINNYLIALKLMEKDKKNIENNWNYLSLLIRIAKAYTDLSEYNKAKFYYNKILDIEPNIEIVKTNLYPQLLKTINNE